MSDIIILIGGTGAKIMEAMVHMAACGLYGPRSMDAFFVDLEATNGNHLAAVKSLNNYNESRKCLALSDTSMFASNLDKLTPELWNPLGARKDVTLDKYFNRGDLSEKSRFFYDAMFTDAERNVKLDKGCLGHQNIGAVIMANQMKLKTEEPWKTVWGKIEQALGGGSADGARVFVAGSVFGGTGAPGLSTVPAVIFEGIQDAYDGIPLQMNLLSIGGFMALPYFAFSDFKSEKSIKAKAKNFVHKTRQAVEYYFQTESIRRYTSVYMAGNDEQTQVRDAIEGGPQQRNEPHFIELLGAIALFDFITHPTPDSTEFNLTATENKGVIDWDDLPLEPNEINLIKKMVKFAFAYTGVYRPTLLNIKNEKTKPKEATWYQEFFLNKGIKVGDEDVEICLDNLDKYTRDFLLWMAHLHVSSKRGSSEQLHLLEYKSFSQEVIIDEKSEWQLLPKFNFSNFQNLIKGNSRKHELSDIWDKMCSYKRKDIGGEKVGAFIKALYDSVG